MFFFKQCAKPLLIGLALLTMVSSCRNVRTQNDVATNLDYLTYATIWFQRAPEARALYYQGFNIARAQLPALIEQGDLRPKAVIVDIDETMLDNGPFEAQEILDGRNYSDEFWQEWTLQGRAQALPGAVEFSRFCDSLGVQVFYVSNRLSNELQATQRNLDSLGFAWARVENIMLKDSTSSKMARRAKVAERFDVLMLIGDNLSDFADVFESRGDDWGMALVEQYRHEFGRRFIILPNPMYGEWERSLYGSFSRPEAEKVAARRAALKGFK